MCAQVDLLWLWIFNLSGYYKDLVLSQFVVFSDLPSSDDDTNRGLGDGEVFEIEGQSPVCTEGLHVFDVKLIDLSVFSPSYEMDNVFLDFVFTLFLQVVKWDGELLRQEPWLLRDLPLLEVVEKSPYLSLDVKDLDWIQDSLCWLASKYEDEFLFRLEDVWWSLG